jgi:hypothetical protein
MRTGSHVHAYFKGRHRDEYTLFTLASGTPLTSMDGRTAARQIVAALRRGEAEVILTWQAGLLARLNRIAPGLTTDVLRLVNHLLPGGGGIGRTRRTGAQSQTALSESPITTLAQQATARFNQ